MMRCLGLVLIVINAFILKSLAINTDQLFESWFLANGGELHGVQVAEFQGMGRGLVVQKDTSIRQNQKVLSIPSKLIFSLKSMKVQKNQIVRNLIKSLPGEIALNFWILFERCKGKSSFYKEYIDILPKNVPSLLSFNLKELNELQNKELILEVLKMQNQAHEDFSRSIEIVKSFSVKEEIKGYSCLCETTVDDYLWALSIINSRGLRFRGEIYLAPMADLFNYEPHHDKRVASSGEFFLKHHKLDPQEGSVEIFADRSQSGGLQLFEDYGDNTNEIYLKYHGFVPNANPFHCVTVHYTAAANGTVLTPKQLSLVNLLHLPISPKKCINNNDEPTYFFGKQLEIFATVSAMSDSDIDECIAIVNKNSNSNNPNKWNVIYNECKFQRVANHFQSRLQSLSEGDEELESDGEIAELEQRSWSTLKRLVVSAIHDLDFSTSAHEDVELLSSLLEKLHAGEKIFEGMHIEHLILAIKYRLFNKRQYSKICSILQLSQERTCEALIRRPLIDASNTRASTAEITTKPSTSRARAQKLVEAADDYYEDNEDDAEEQSSASNSLVTLLENFNNWFAAEIARHSLKNKLRAAAMPIYRIGTIASEEIAAEEVYLEVPDSVIMSADHAFNNFNEQVEVTAQRNVSALLRALATKYRSRDDFHELLFALLHEKFIAAERSPFRHYLQLLPSAADLDVPLLWSDQQLKDRLSAFSVVLYESALEYQAKLLRRFKFISDISEVQEYFNFQGTQIFSLENYRWATAILDSRSIWWEGKRHLVPMLDFINCRTEISGQDKRVLSRVHSTAFDHPKHAAVTRSPARFHRSEQVYENYGQPNHIYFLYHGFSLEENPHDCVLHSVAWDGSDAQYLQQQSNLLQALAHKLGIPAREEGSVSACLRSPLPLNVWTLLIFKTKSMTEKLAKQIQAIISDPAFSLHDDHALAKNFQPSKEAMELLVRSLKERLKKYSSSSIKAIKHAATERFLTTEKKLLQSLLRDTERALSDLSEEDEL